MMISCHCVLYLLFVYKYDSSNEIKNIFFCVSARLTNEKQNDFAFPKIISSIVVMFMLYIVYMHSKF